MTEELSCSIHCTTLSVSSCQCEREKQTQLLPFAVARNSQVYFELQQKQGRPSRVTPTTTPPFAVSANYVQKHTQMQSNTHKNTYNYNYNIVYMLNYLHIQGHYIRFISILSVPILLFIQHLGHLEQQAHIAAFTKCQFSQHHIKPEILNFYLICTRSYELAFCSSFFRGHSIFSSSKQALSHSQKQ